ncbi:hypothetical protein GCM10027612_16790 [Microbispora bryophytorum subsp. camponoti]
MDGIAATLGTAFAVFAGTNVDDVVILTVLFLSARAKGRLHPGRSSPVSTHHRVVGRLISLL